MKKNIMLISIYSLLFILDIALLWIAPFYLWLSIVLTVMLSAVVFLCIFFYFKKHKYYSITCVIYYLCSFLIIIFAIFYFTGLIENFRDIESARQWFDSFGILSWLMLFFIQLLQVIILPIPAQVTTIAGVLIFGALQCFVISATAIIVGSLICFGIGKWLGVQVAYKVADKETVDKYRKLLDKKGKVLLPVFFLLPCFPDDLLCFVAGATTMTWKFFIVVTLLTRTIGVACICWLGSGELIPFSGWGIPVWIVLGVLLAVVIFFFLKYQNKIENWIINKFTNKKNKKRD